MLTRNIILNLLLLVVVSMIASCSKTAITTPIQFQKQLLSGTGTFQNTQHSWLLDSAYINGASITLTAAQKTYKKTFTFDGGYNDSDNNNGKWEITTINKLKQTIVYQLTNKQDSTTYDIVSINAATLNLSLKLSNGQTANYLFKIAN